MNLASLLQNSKIGILGQGYLGSCLSNFLLDLKIDGLEISSINRGNWKILEEETFDYFINCAGNSGDFRENVFETIDSNITLINNLIKILKVRKSLVTISSTRVYGFSSDKTVVFSEDDFSESNHLDINYIYDGAKKITESVLYNSSNKLAYKIKIARLSNVYGKFNQLDDSTLIKQIVKRKIDNAPLITTVNPVSRKDYIYIDDAIRGIISLLFCKNKFEVYNIGFGKSSSLEEISKILNLEIKYQSTVPIVHNNISVNKAAAILGFKPEIDLQSGLQKIISDV